MKRACTRAGDGGDGGMLCGCGGGGASMFGGSVGDDSGDEG